jgi:Ca2+-binding RTX toxin-like protein
MARILRGTNGNDTIEAFGFGRFEFEEIGYGKDTVTGGISNDIFRMLVDKTSDRIDGRGGRDLIDYQASGVQLNIDLSTGIVQGNFGSSATPKWLTVTEVSNVEDVIGSAFDDTIVGSSAANTLNGGAGNDVINAGGGNDTLIGGGGTNTLNGGKGIDTVDYSASQYSISASLASGGLEWIPVEGGWGAYGALDMYTSIENLIGSSQDDRLGGSAGANVIDGRDGNDIIEGGDGNDTLRGGAGADELAGGDGDDSIFGGSGDDVLSGGWGTNQIDGGDGVDTVDYSGEAHGVWVGLGDNWGHRGEIRVNYQAVSHDTYTSIENINGTNYDDGLYGDDGDNVINGYDGDDNLFGNGGNDTLNGGEGDDLIKGDSGADHLDGGSGNNWLAYTWSESGVTVNLATSATSGGDAEGDVISNFQNIIGSTHNDVLTGSSTDNILLGLGGNDRFTGGGGHDTFAFLGPVTGVNVVTDFHIGEDKLEFLQADPTQGVYYRQIGAHTVISFGNAEGGIILQNVNTSEFLQHLSSSIEYVETYDVLM